MYMDSDYKIRLEDAMIAAKEILELFTDINYEMIRLCVELPKENGIGEYASIVLCEQGRKKDIIKEVRETSITSVKDIKSIPGVCHLAIFSSIRKPAFISFDDNDLERFAKADINAEYQYVESFLKSYIRYRGKLSKDTKSDRIYDLFEYLELYKAVYMENTNVHKRKKA